PRPGRSHLPAPVQGTVARAERLLAELHPQARRFLRAFLRYEVGDTASDVKRELIAGATSRFSRRLLRLPPRSVARGSFPPLARLGHLGTTFVSAAANRVLVSGVAYRGRAREQLSFLFVRAGSHWLASGPGQ